MDKGTFLYGLRERLAGLPQDDIEERLVFYGEMIDHRMSEGMSEEAAIASLGSMEEISSYVMSEIPLNKFVMRRVGNRSGMSGGKLVLLLLTFPIWLPFLIVAVALVFSVYTVLWALIFSFYTVVLAFAVVSVMSVPAAVLLMLVGKPAGGVFLLGAGMMMAGVTMIVFAICRKLSRGLIGATRHFAIWIKSLFVKKGGDDHAYEH